MEAEMMQNEDPIDVLAIRWLLSNNGGPSGVHQGVTSIATALSLDISVVTDALHNRVTYGDLSRLETSGYNAYDSLDPKHIETRLAYQVTEKGASELEAHDRRILTKKQVDTIDGLVRSALESAEAAKSSAKSATISFVVAIISAGIALATLLLKSSCS